jgi:hypothetical protein
MNMQNYHSEFQNFSQRVYDIMNIRCGLEKDVQNYYIKETSQTAMVTGSKLINGDNLKIMT